jgi:ATP-dependent Clp protease ATP-binding subunit ClpB
LQDPSRPMGSFLLLGPTGVGKTELARALAEFLFDDEHCMVRIDMSEYMEKQAVSRLIGAPPGYVGYDEAGQLTEPVRRRPHSVVLLDEIEKAHGDVLNILLQVLDDGRLTDGQGRTVNFRNTLVIMTSNIGSQHILEVAEQSEMRGLIEGDLRKKFRPEFLNRVDDVIVFHRLNHEQIRRIVDIQLRRATRRASIGRSITLEFTDRAKEFLGGKGYHSAYGARPLKRAIGRYVLEPLAKKCLCGDVGEGNRVVVDLAGDQLSFSVPGE